MPTINKSILSTLHDFADACFQSGLNCPHIPDLYGWAMQQNTAGQAGTALTNQPRGTGKQPSTAQQIAAFLATQNLGVNSAQITAWLKSQGLKVPRNGIGPLMASVRRNKLGTQQNGLWFGTAKAAAKPANVTTLSKARRAKAGNGRRTRKTATANANQQQQAATG